MCFVFTVSDEFSAYTEFVFLKKEHKIYFLSNEKDSNVENWIKSNIEYEDKIIYFGGHSELLRLFHNSFPTNLNYYDLLHRVWNLNTSITNHTLDSCFQQCLECCSKLDLKDNLILRAKIFKSCKNIDEIKKHIFIICSYIKENSNTIIELEDNNPFYNQINDIFFVLEFIYHFLEINMNKIYADRIDDDICLALANLEDSNIRLDYNYLRSVRQKLNDSLSYLLTAIYSISNKKFNINSPRELNYVLKEIGVLNHKTSNIELKNNYEQTGLSIFHYIDLYRKTNICLEQYIKPLYESAINNKFGRFKYNTCKVPCLTKGHLCVERKKGIIDVSEIKLGDFIWTEYGFKKVIRNQSYKSDELIKVSFSNGITIIGTKHHPILVNNANQFGKYYSINREWVSLNELFVGEHVICNYNYKDLINFDNDNLEDYLNRTAIILCNIISKYASNENGFLCLKNMFFSDVLPFVNFKMYCELFGLKFWSFESTKNNKVYDIVFYDVCGINYLLKRYKRFLSERVLSLIDEILLNADNSFEKKTDNQSGYFNLNYEETTVLAIKELGYSDVVYDIEVEDVHQYNANSIVHHNTGRLSSSRSSSKNKYYTNVNIQSVPKNDVNDINIRKCFLPEEDCYWCCIDYKSQEMRLASCLYNIHDIKQIPVTEDIYESIGNKFDIFSKSSLSKEKVRSAIKIISLGMIYGLTNEGIVKQLKLIGIDDDETIDYRYLFYKNYPELLVGQKRTLDYAHSIGGIYTLSGRFREIKFNKNDYNEFLTRNNRIALNTIIQGTCGDIMRILINNIEKEIKPCYSDYGFKFLSTIHDEINVSVPKDPILFNEILNKLLSLIISPIRQRKDITFGYTLSIGDNWGCLKKHNFG